MTTGQGSIQTVAASVRLFLYVQLCLPVGAGEEFQVPACTQQLCVVFYDS